MAISLEKVLANSIIHSDVDGTLGAPGSASVKSLSLACQAYANIHHLNITISPWQVPLDPDEIPACTDESRLQMWWLS
ncbi:MAG: hypothetical protein WCJ58_07005 [bacterium]